MRRLLAIAALTLAGCAAYNQEGVNALNRGDLSAAERHFMDGVQQGDPMSINNMGVVYERRGDRGAAVRFYTLAARWGIPLAQQNLARMGEPVPRADLAAQRAQTDAANAAATLQLMRTLQPVQVPFQPLPTAGPTLRCTSQNMGGGMVSSNCN